MSDFRCQECNRYVGSVVATIRGGEQIVQVDGICKRHGKVQAVGDYGWEDFYGPEDEEPDVL